MINEVQVKAATAELAATYRKESNNLERAAPKLAIALRIEAASMAEDLGLDDESIPVLTLPALPANDLSSEEPSVRRSRVHASVDKESEDHLLRKGMRQSMDRRPRAPISIRRARLPVTTMIAMLMTGIVAVVTFSASL